MQINTQQLAQAHSLLADIQAAPRSYLPRREIIEEWLSAFLQRAQSPDYALGETEAEDLRSLARFLRESKIAAV